MDSQDLEDTDVCDNTSILSKKSGSRKRIVKVKRPEFYSPDLPPKRRQLHFPGTIDELEDPETDRQGFGLKLMNMGKVGTMGTLPGTVSTLPGTIGTLPAIGTNASNSPMKKRKKMFSPTKARESTRYADLNIDYEKQQRQGLMKLSIKKFDDDAKKHEALLKSKMAKGKKIDPALKLASEEALNDVLVAGMQAKLKFLSELRDD